MTTAPKSPSPEEIALAVIRELESDKEEFILNDPRAVTIIAAAMRAERERRIEMPTEEAAENETRYMDGNCYFGFMSGYRWLRAEIERRNGK